MNRKPGDAMLIATMSLRSTVAAVLAGLVASGCVIVPITIENYDPDCRVVTRHMELKTDRKSVV